MVVVIDLSEMYTVGPLLRVLDEPNERIRPHWERSRLQSIVYRPGTQIERFGEMSVGEVVPDVLKPPELINDETIATIRLDIIKIQENKQIGGSGSE